MKSKNKYKPVIKNNRAGAYHMGFVDGMLWATHNPAMALDIFQQRTETVDGIDLVEEAVSNFVLNFGSNVTAYRERTNAPLDILNMPSNLGGN